MEVEIEKTSMVRTIMKLRRPAPLVFGLFTLKIRRDYRFRLLHGSKEIATGIDRMRGIPASGSFRCLCICVL